MDPLNNGTAGNIDGANNILGIEECQIYLLFRDEAMLSHGFRGFLYFLGLAYCFIGLSAITARFFRSMENVVKHSRTVEEIDPCTNTKIVRQEKVWNYTIADITLLAFGTSFPQISLATIDAIRNLGSLSAGGLFFHALRISNCVTFDKLVNVRLSLLSSFLISIENLGFYFNINFFIELD